MKEIYEKTGGRAIRRIAEDLGIAGNTVRRYLKSPDATRPQPRPQRSSKLDLHTEYVDQRMSQELGKCLVLYRELKDLGYDGGCQILKSYVSHPTVVVGNTKPP